MLRIHIDGEEITLNDINSVVDRSWKLASTLNKEQRSISYYLFIWNVAAGVVCIGWIESISNIADTMTNILAAARRSRLFVDWTYLNRIISIWDKINMAI